MRCCSLLLYADADVTLHAISIWCAHIPCKNYCLLLKALDRNVETHRDPILNTIAATLYSIFWPMANLIWTPMSTRAGCVINLMHMHSCILKRETGVGLDEYWAEKENMWPISPQWTRNKRHDTSECLAFEDIRRDIQELLHDCTRLEEIQIRTESSVMTLGMPIPRSLDHRTKLIGDPNSEIRKHA